MCWHDTYIDMTGGRRCNNNWKVQSFFCLQRTAGSAVLYCLFSSFFNNERCAVGVVFVVTDSCADLRLAVGRMVTPRSTSNLEHKPVEAPPLANTSTSALMMLASSIQEKTFLNWNRQRDYEAFPAKFWKISDESELILCTCLTTSRFWRSVKVKLQNRRACAIKNFISELVS